jgi:DNA-binding GntR family transcriptional regulator
MEMSATAAKTIPLLSERAYERVKHDIICCLIPPGTEVSEAQLCEQYKLGKAPVRMALSRLAHDGLVRAIPRRGYMVTAVTLKDIQDARRRTGRCQAAAGARRNMPRRLPVR